MVTAVIVAIAATLVSGVFSADLARAFVRRRRPHAGVWAVSLGLFALACAAVAVGLAVGWHPVVYGTFWFAGALVTVPLLAVGQMLLLDPSRWRIWLIAAGVVVLAGGWAVVASPMSQAGLSAADARGGIPMGDDVWGTSPATALLAPFNWSGLIVVAGCAWSAFRSRRPMVLLIAVGVLVAGASFGFVRAGNPSVFTVTLAAGVTVMYAGFRAAATSPSRAPTSAAANGRVSR